MEQGFARLGRRTGVRTQPPPGRLSSRRIYSAAARLAPADEVESWNRRNAPLLSLYGLEIASVVQVPLRGEGRAAAGALQGALRDRLLLTGMLGALAVSMSGRGDLLDVEPKQRDQVKKAVKENNDRNSTAAMTEALYALCAADPDLSLHVAIGEGARLKPGEKGGNPTLYAGQTIGAGSRRCALAVDTVEGTTKSTLFDPSCGTLLYVTQASIAPVPDVYFDKCQLAGISSVSVADPLERIVAAVMDEARTREINIFALDRPRHPIEKMLALGANMRIDTDGDAYPVIAAGLAFGVFPDNLRFLDGVCGNIGGAAEMIASAAGASYLGVRSTARFCASKIPSWDARYDFSADDEKEIRAHGLDPARVYRIEDLVTGLHESDGAFVACAITDNWHIPGLDAAFVGANFATVCGLFVGAAGTADLYRVTFGYRQPLAQTAARITPVLTRLLALPESDLGAAVREAVGDPARAGRLRREIATSFYMHIANRAELAREDTPMELDLAAASKVEPPATLTLLKALAAAAAGWFQ